MKVLVADKLSESGVKKLKEAGLAVDVKIGLPEDELVKIIPDYDALVVRSATKVTDKIIEAAGKLKIIARAGVGVDNVNLEAATKKGITVVNSPSGNTVAAAEHTLAMMMALARNIPKAYVSLRGGKWERSKFVGREVFGKKLGLIGLGKIGSRVVHYAQALEMEVYVYDPFVSKEYADKMGVELKSLEEVLKIADFITFHIPKTKETYHLIDKKKLSLMKDGVYLINCARGGIIDEKALEEALKSGKVGGAALDVFEKEPASDNPLVKMDNVLAVPHLGASTVEAQVNVAVDVVEQIIDFGRGEPARSAVNIPSLKPEIITPVKQYIPLAEKLGSLSCQLSGGEFKEVGIIYQGEVAKRDTAPLTLSIIKGLLDPIMPHSVNFVNASLVARERGVKITESKDEEVKDYANLISVTVKSKKGQRMVAGTLYGGYGERIVQVDGFRVEAVPEGYMLIVPNADRPGMVGRVGTLLGENKINIASMDVGRESIGGKAVMVLNIDGTVSDKVLAEIAKMEGISGQPQLVKI